MKNEKRKNSKRKRICLSLLLVLLLMVTGCGGKRTEESGAGKKSEQENNNNSTGTEQKNQSQEDETKNNVNDNTEKEDQQDKDDEKQETGIYQEGAFFQFDLVSAKTEDKKWGFMNRKGEWVIPPVYRSVHDFGPNKLAFVSKATKKWSIIDTTGKVVSEREYTYVSPFSACGIAAVEEKQSSGMKRYYVYVDSDGKLVEYDATKWLVTGDFSSDGYAAVSVWDEETTSDYFGLIDRNFNYVIEPTKGLRLGNVSNGMVTVIDEINQLSGMMNMKGEWVFKTGGYLEYFISTAYANGRILDRYNIIRDKDGVVVADVTELTKDLPMGPYSSESSKSYTYGDWLLVVSGSKNSSFNVNYLDENLNVVFPYPLHFYSNDGYGSGYGDMRYGRLIVKLPVEKDASGKIIGISEVSDDKSEYATVVIDEQKNIVFVPAEIGCSSVNEYYSDGYTFARSGNKEFGILDRSGNIITRVNGVADFKAD